MGLLRIPSENNASMAETTTVIQEDEVVEQVEAQWELAECTCPDWCERDHELD
jgi:hypothetical protein